jgi:hypothetical protein
MFISCRPLGLLLGFELWGNEPFSTDYREGEDLPGNEWSMGIITWWIPGSHKGMVGLKIIIGNLASCKRRKGI